MKKIFTYISIVALAAISAGCAQELVNPEDQLTDSNKTELVNGELTVQLSVPESAQTRTVLGVKDGSNYPVYWSQDDVITLNGTAATEFIPSDDNTTATAKFKVTNLTAPYNFLYGGVSGSSDQVSFPATQQYVTDSFDPAAMPMYASLTNVNDNVTFSHVGALLRFSFTGTNQLSSITLSAADKSKSLSGNFTINLSDGTLTPVSGSSSILYNFGEAKQLSETPFVFYVAVPAGTYPGGIVLEVIDNEAGHMTVKIMEAEEDATIEAGKVREFENVVYTPQKEANLIQIDSEATLQAFATRVAGGETTLNARVIADFTVTSAWTPVVGYKGIFEGNSKTITGLDQPLFDELGGVVKNLTLNSTISATDAEDLSWGMFAKVVYPSVELDDVGGLQNCTAQGTLTYTPSAALSSSTRIGGLVGDNRGGAVTNCINEATVTMEDSGETHASQVSIGGIVGYTAKGGDLNAQGDISNCINNGTVTCNAKLSENLYIGGVVGHQVDKNEYISGCVNNGLVKVTSSFSTSKALHLGGVIGLGAGKIESCTNGSEGTVTSEAGSTAGTYVCQGGVVGRISNKTLTYSGLTNAGDINAAAAGAATGSYIGGMAGRCDEGASLSDCTNTGGTLEYTGATSTCPLHIGGIVGQSTNSVSSCTNGTAVIVGGEYSLNSSGKYLSIGGVIGRQAADVEISNNKNTAAVTFSGTSTGYTALGGIVGYCDGPISGGENSGTVSFTGSSNNQNTPIGGVVARTPGSKSGDRVTGVTNRGTVIVNTTTQNAKDLYVGGVAGHHQSGNLTAVNTGNVQVTNLSCSILGLGGVAGKAAGKVSGTNEGVITTEAGCSTSSDLYIAGVVGTSSGEVESCTNSGTVSNGGKVSAKGAYLCVGGIGGWCDDKSSLNECHNTGNVTNTATQTGYLSVGGVAGESGAAIEDSHNEGHVTNNGASGNSKRIAVGGVVGYTSAALTSSYNTGEVYNDGASAGNVAMAGVVGFSKKITLTECYNTGSVTNDGTAGAGILVGGVSGLSDGCTFDVCYNTGGISNYGKATDISKDADYGTAGGYSSFAVDVCIGGVTGMLVNDNTLTGTETEYNYNDGTVYDESASAYISLGGVAGYIKTSDASDLSYARNLSNGLVYIHGETRTKAYIGGVLGCADNAFTMDYASNAGTIRWRSVTIKETCFTGGVFGAWYSSAQNTECTITGCTNSGMIDCFNDDGGKGANMAVGSSASKNHYTYVGGISGVGDNYSKYFFNCINTGRIAVYNQLKTRLGGVLGYTDVNPAGCVNTGRINYCRWNPKGYGGNGEIGGVVGYMNVKTPTNLTNDATVKTTSSDPNCYTGGIIGRTNTETVGFKDCKVGSSGTGDAERTISGAGENAFGSTAAGLFCSDGNSGHAWDFTGCVIKRGTKVSKIEVTSDNLGDAIIGRNHATSITNAPTFVDSF